MSILQLDLHIAMLTLVLVLVPSTWMMSSVLQVLASYWSAPVGQSYLITVFTLLMLVWDVKVSVFCCIYDGRFMLSSSGLQISKTNVHLIYTQLLAQLVSYDW